MRRHFDLERARRIALPPRTLAVLALAASLQGCVGALFAHTPTVPEMMEAGEGAPARRAMQTRRMDVPPAAAQLAAVSVIQDLGYQIRLSDGRLGLISGMRRRLAFLEGLGEGELQLLQWFATFGYVPYPDPQYKNFDGTAVIVVISPAPQQPAACSVRVQFFRFRRAPLGQEIAWADMLVNEADYARFFQLLRDAVARDAAVK